jgi:hypothetical protein
MVFLWENPNTYQGENTYQVRENTTKRIVNRLG